MLIGSIACLLKNIKSLYEHAVSISKKCGWPLGQEADFDGTVYRWGKGDRENRRWESNEEQSWRNLPHRTLYSTLGAKWSFQRACELWDTGLYRPGFNLCTEPVGDFSLFFPPFTLSGLLLLTSPSGRCSPARTLPLMISSLIS